jgi:hypothetical protein
VSGYSISISISISIYIKAGISRNHKKIPQLSMFNDTKFVSYFVGDNLLRIIIILNKSQSQKHHKSQSLSIAINGIMKL